MQGRKSSVLPGQCSVKIARVRRVSVSPGVDKDAFSRDIKSGARVS